MERPQNTHLKRGPGGRQRGSQNKRTKEIEAMAKSLLNDPVYREHLITRLQEGSAGPIEVLLYHYAYGKPRERVEISGLEGGPLPVQIYLPAKHPLSDA